MLKNSFDLSFKMIGPLGVVNIVRTFFKKGVEKGLKKGSLYKGGFLPCRK